MAPKRSQSNVLGVILLAGIVVALLTMSALSVYGGVREFSRILQGEWATSQGEVMSTFVVHKRRGRVRVVEYEYLVEGNTYRGYHHTQQTYSPRDRIVVFYDQKHPIESDAENHPRKGLPQAFLMIVVGLVLLVPSGVATLLFFSPAAAIRLLVFLTGLFSQLPIKQKHPHRSTPTS